MTDEKNTYRPIEKEPVIDAGQPSVAPEPAAKVDSQAPAQIERSRLSPGAIFFGALISLGFVAFVLLARVTVHPFDQIDRRMRVLDVWQRLRNDLPDVAHPTLLRVVFDVSIILIVVGSLACVWLALLAASDGNQTNDETNSLATPLDHSEHRAPST